MERNVISNEILDYIRANQDDLDPVIVESQDQQNGPSRRSWKRLDAALGQHEIKWEWVKGHAGHPENERCDELARAAASNPAHEDAGYQPDV